MAWATQPTPPRSGCPYTLRSTPPRDAPLHTGRRCWRRRRPDPGRLAGQPRRWGGRDRRRRVGHQVGRTGAPVMNGEGGVRNSRSTGARTDAATLWDWPGRIRYPAPRTVSATVRAPPWRATGLLAPVRARVGVGTGVSQVAGWAAPVVKMAAS